jgi:ribonuclease HI
LTGHSSPAVHGFTIHVDGSSRFNPGPAGLGVRISGPDGSVIKEISRAIGVRTNNQAEYEALLCALRECRGLPAVPIVIHTDSELVFCQVTGRYRVRDTGLRPLHAAAARLLTDLPNVSLRLVRREENRETDRLARAASGVTDS